jgi:type I restriction enzyme S subunit
MSLLESLLSEHCPGGVEYKALGELGDFYGGLTGKSKEDFKDGNAKFITYMNVFNNLDVNTDISDRVKIGETERQRTVQLGDVLFTGSSETPDECGMAAVMTTQSDEPLYLNSFCFGFRLFDAALLLPGFSKYLFRSEELRKQIVRTASGVTRFNVSKEKMKKVRIPLPPIPVQRKIVEILDNFTELTAELTARKTQYEYYRDSLLSFSETERVKWLTLGQIAQEIFRGAGIKRDQVTETGTPCVRYGEIYTTYDVWFKECVSHTDAATIPSKKYFSHGDVLFAITGESVEEIAKSTAYVGHENCLAGGDIVVVKHTQNPKYLSYALSTTDAQVQKSKGKVKSKVVHSSTSAIANLCVPVPPIEEQNRIADILDNFYNLVTDLTGGLPAEIAARQKQYEYYRDKLLTFKEKVA